MSVPLESNDGVANAPDQTTTAPDKPPQPIFSNRNYRFHWSSTALFSLADYFTLIAMPWLVLMITKDPAALGLVMALESLPRAAFMLISGGYSDRHSPRKVLIYSRGLFFIALTMLGLLLLFGELHIQQLYVFSFIFGVCAAFAMPAATSLLPQIVDESQIEMANGALMGTQQMIQLFTPVLAGLLIWGVTSATPESTSMTNNTDLAQFAYAFLISSGAIFTALLLLFKVKIISAAQANPDDVKLIDGFRYVGRDKGLSIAIFYMAIITFFAVGPLLTVMPQFADLRLDKGALSYGLLFTANGIGAVIGFGLSGVIKQPNPRNVGLILFSADLIAGICVIWFGNSFSFLMAAPALAVMGFANSFGMVLCISWMQRRIPAAISGRVLGLVMFATMGLTPVSMTIAGFVVANYSLTVLMSISGTAISICALIGLVIPAINRFGIYPSPAMADS